MRTLAARFLHHIQPHPSLTRVCPIQLFSGRACPNRLSDRGSWGSLLWLSEQNFEVSGYQRYDRQLRIWGAHGQGRLEQAKICVVNGGPSGTEAMKNLVLGGIGACTVVDSDLVGDEDFGLNYLVDYEGRGGLRAEVVVRLLKEMNESVALSCITESVADVVDQRPEVFKDFSLVIATQIRVPLLRKLVGICQEAGVPLIALKSYGLLGMMKVYVKEVCIVESKPDDEVPDLRLSRPWKELEEFSNSIDLDSLTDVQHAHVPYIVILLKAGEYWKSKEGTDRPVEFNQKKKFKEIINRLRRKDKANSIEVAPDIQRILDDGAANVTVGSTDFWIVVAALKAFIEETGMLPLSGSVPDMTATTELYLKVQSVYNEKARSDCDRVASLAEGILEKMGRSGEDIPRDKVSLICKNSRNLRLIRSSPLFLHEDPSLMKILRDQKTFRNSSYVLLLEAVDQFYRIYARQPGTQSEEEWIDDVPLLMNILQSMTDISALEEELKSEIHSMAHEVCRFGGGELHTVSAVMGGIAAQEAIKILTEQFIPFDGTLLYNGIDSTTSKF